MKLHLKQHINAPPNVAFQKATDLERWPGCISGISAIELVTEGEIGVGTVFRETRIMMKREVTEEMAITLFEPPRMYVVESDSCGAHFRTTVRFHADGEGTCMEMEMVTVATTLMAKLMIPLGMVMKGMMTKLIARDMQDLATAIDGGV
jgi:carbon monoxide dehydrogenase subunit G